MFSITRSRVAAISMTLCMVVGLIPEKSAFTAPPPPGGPEEELTQPVVGAPVEPAANEHLPAAAVVSFGSGPVEETVNHADPFLGAAAAAETVDPLLQAVTGEGAMPLPMLNFEGQGNRDRLVPPDTNGQVGPDHYVQMVNTSTAVYDKAGRLLYGPFHPGDLWPAGDVCNVNNDGDPVVLYDPMADRWILSQFALPNDQVMGPYYECIAVSRGPAPTNRPGDWYVYSFIVHATKMNDYPKLGVWPDGYAMSANQFTATQAAGVGVWVFDRRQMLQGLPATFQYFDLEPMNPGYWGLLPANLLGSTPPPLGTPVYFGAVDQDWNGTDDVFHLFEFHVDWEDPGRSTFRLARDLIVAPYDAHFGASRSSIPQPGTMNKLDAIPGRLMMHLWYRNFGDTSVLTANHTVDADGSDHAGIRWYEIRNPGAGATIFQQGTYAPDGHHRWMGSLAMDRAGNMALGYSISGSTLYPGARYTGREAGDPPGTMTMTEAVLVNGGGAQTTTSRWGDYSAISLDPLDDCTFWYTQMYIAAGSSDWRTRIGSFRFPGCNASAGSLQGQALDPGGAPLEGVQIAAVPDSAKEKSYLASSGPDGRYGLYGLPPGSYTITASLYGYSALETGGVEVRSGETTRLDLSLQAASQVAVSGVARDAITGWPLYVRVQAPGYPVEAVFSDPLTGRYSLRLVSGLAYSLTFSAELDGYPGLTRDLGALTGSRVLDASLPADLTACTAAGYRTFASGYAQDFEAGDGGFVHSGAGDQWAWGSPQTWPGSCASGHGCWGTNLAGNYAPDADMVLISPEIPLPAVAPGAPLSVHWAQAWQIENAVYDAASVDVSLGGGAWQTLWQHSGATGGKGWTSLHYDLSYAAGQRARFRWRLASDAAVEYAGLYLDDFSITTGCEAQSGGLVVGQVSAADGRPLPGSTVTGPSGMTVAAHETPEDENLGEAFYSLFSPAGPQTFQAQGVYGYGTVAGAVEVAAGGAARLDFSLSEAQTFTVEGQVTDAATGWPLAARIAIDGYPEQEVWSEPQSGRYRVELAEGRSYTLRAAAWTPGYAAQETTLPPLGSAVVQDFALDAAVESCQAPGYRRSNGLVETFSAHGLPPGWTVVNPGGTEGWVFNDPKGRGNQTGGTDGFAIVDSDSLGRVDVDSELRTPPVDFSASSRVTLAFKSDYRSYTEDIASVEVSANGPEGPWVNVWRQTADARGPSSVTLDLSAIAAGQANVMARFHYSNANYDWWWQVDDVVLGESPECEPPAGGGLAVGSVADANTLAALPGSLVTSSAGPAVSAQPAGPLGAFYSLYLPSGAHTLQASGPAAYGIAAAEISVLDGSATRQDLNLPAGRLSYTPDSLAATIEGPEAAAALPLEMRNDGSLAAAYSLTVLPYEPPQSGDFQTPDYRVKPFKQDFRPTAPADLPVMGMLPAAETAPDLPGAAVGDSWESGAPAAWGVAYDSRRQRVWLSSPGEGWGGEARLLARLPDGSTEKGGWAHPFAALYGPADLAYDPFGDRLWILNVHSGEDNCIHAIDVETGYTGERICPGGEAGFAVSQRGLAYDPRTETWLAASWNDGSIYRFDAQGSILSQVYTGLPASGLAYNPVSRRLFVLLSAQETRIVVLDESSGFSLLGQIRLAEFSAYGGAGLEMDGEGDLWAVDQLAGRVYRIETDEPPLSALAAEVDWLTPDVPGGELAPGASTTVQFRADGRAAALQEPGLYQARVYWNQDTPYPVGPLPVSVTVAAPAGYGLLQGVVSTRGYCDSHPAPLQGAAVTLGSAERAKTAITRSDGSYQIWMEAGTYTLTVSHPGHVAAPAAGILLAAAATESRDLALRWNEPCVGVSPEVVEVVVAPGIRQQVPLRLSNAGAAGTPFTLDIQDSLPAGLSFAPAGGELAPGSSVEILIAVDGEAWDGSQGGQTIELSLATDDPVTPRRRVPIHLMPVLPERLYLPIVHQP